MKGIIISIASIAVIASAGIPLYMSHQQTVQAAALIVQQEEEAAEQSRLEAEAQEAAQARIKAEAEAREQAEAAKIEAEAQAAEEAEHLAAELQAEQARQELEAKIQPLSSQAPQAPPEAPAELVRVEEQPKPSEAQKAQENSPSVASVEVSTYYQAGMTWSEVEAAISEAIAPYGCWLLNGSISTDGANASNITVISTDKSYRIQIDGWRRSREGTSLGGKYILSSTKAMMVFFWGSQSGSDIFNYIDSSFCESNVNPADYRLSDTGDSSGGKLVHTNGTTVRYTFENGSMSLYVG